VSPPKPEPQVATALAKERFLTNHCGTTPPVEMKQNPRPIPKQRPWLRRRCQTWVEKEAQMKETLGNEYGQLALHAHRG